MSSVLAVTENPFLPPDDSQRTPKEVQAMLEKGAVLFDVREISEFSEVRIPGAKNLPSSKIIKRWEEIPTDRDVIVYCRSGHRSGLGVNMLRNAGYPNIYNLDGGLRAWFNARLPVDTAPVALEPSTKTALFEEISVEEAWHRLDGGVTLVDVREVDEFEHGHIPGAVNLPLRDIEDALPVLRTYIPLMLICDAGIRSDLAAAYLVEQGLEQVSNIKQGITAWRRRKLPWSN